MGDIMLVNGDISISTIGDIVVLDDNDDIIQQTSNNIMTYLGENQFHTGIGNDIYGRRLKMNDNSADIIQQSCTQAILQDIRVSDVLDIKATMSDLEYGLVIIDYTIETENGTVLSNKCQTSMYKSK